MKQDGLDYNQRMEELEKLEYPKPNREFVYSTFNAFAERHPWVGQENIRPKSIAREMFEEFRSFGDYIKIYELQRAEGLLLRHLSGVHKVLTQTVPDAAKNDAVREMELYLGTMIRQVDSSLLEEWERLNDPNYRPPGDEAPEVRPPGWEEAERDITRDAVKSFTALDPHAHLHLPARPGEWRLRGGPRVLTHAWAADETGEHGPLDARASARGAGGLSRRSSPHPPGPGRAQLAAHLRHPGGGQTALGASSRCSSIPTRRTTGRRNSRWTSTRSRESGEPRMQLRRFAPLTA